MPTNTAALILAGGTLDASWDGVRGEVSNRALLPFGGETLLTHAYSSIDSAFRKSGGGRILVVGAPHPFGVPVSGGDTFLQTLQNGLFALLPDEAHLLISTADMPFLTPSAVIDFLEQAMNANVDFTYPIVPAALCREKYPDLRRTNLKTAEGIFTGGNMALVKTTFLQQRFDVLQAAYTRRKSVWGMATLLGGDILVRLALSRAFPQVLSITSLEHSVGKILKGKARAIISLHPELATDVDTPEEYQRTLNLLQKGGV